MAIPEAVQLLDRELREIFGRRLQSLIVYGALEGQPAKDDRHAHAHGAADSPSRTMAVVEGMTREDLRACAKRVDAWHGRGLATPLLVAAREFDRSLDVFPLEFGAILADHVVVSGENPFAASKVEPADVRRACEVQARSHLLHLREGYLEARGRADALSDLIVQSKATPPATPGRRRATPSGFSSSAAAPSPISSRSRAPTNCRRRMGSGCSGHIWRPLSIW